VFGFSGVMAPHWGLAFDVGKAEIGQILSFVLAAVGTFMFLAGSLQRRLGASRVTAAGALLYGAATILVASASTMAAVYILLFSYLGSLLLIASTIVWGASRHTECHF
jgi:hypothetical protein